MKNKITMLMLAIVVTVSVIIAGCGGEAKSAEFEVSNLNVAPVSPYVNQAIMISADVINTGEGAGSYSAVLKVNDVTVESKDIALEPNESQTVTFTYTATTVGPYDIALGGLISGIQVQDEPEGYWSVNYRVVGGRIGLLFSLFGATPEFREVAFSEAQSGTFTMLVNMSSTDGKRDVIIPEDAWYFQPIFVEECLSGVDMTLTMSLSSNASGWLYIQDGAGDVDVISESSSGRDPIQVNTVGDGIMDPAGSMLLNMPLHGLAETTQGAIINLPFDLMFTTGHIYNIVLRPDKGINGSVMESDGVPFARDGGPSPHVGTAGTITTTGTGDCLNLRLVGFETDFQAEITLEIVPE